jgi:long-chain acyl-CoA synthetase
MKEKMPIHSKDNLELDLGLDSLGRIELVVALEQVFSVKLPETFALEIQNVEELVEKMKNLGPMALREIDQVSVWSDVLRTEPVAGDRGKIGLHQGFIDRIIVFLGLHLVKMVMKVFFGLRAEGLRNLPEQGPYIIAPNHASYLDAFCIGAAIPSRCFSDLYSLGMQQYFASRPGRYFAHLAHVIPIDTELHLHRALQLSSYVLRNGKSLLIFPEGGRSYDGNLMGFKKGVGILAEELNIPVIPAFIRGSFQALPRGATWPAIGRITVIFGEPLHPSEILQSKDTAGVDRYQYFVDMVKDRVERLRDQMVRGTAKPPGDR